MRYWSLLLLQFFIISASAQTRTHLSGFVQNHLQEPLPNVMVRVLNSKVITHSDSAGRFSLYAPAERVVISYSKAGFKEQKLELELYGHEQYSQNMTLYPMGQFLNEVTIKDQGENFTSAVPFNSSTFSLRSLPGGNFESLLKTLPGISTNNELTSQYSVRGGNFDENLVYVNDFEVYRPFMTRNGQQEGLSFINPELAGSVKFSAGGFEARYGDKLSSVLDVTYTRPDSTTYLGAVGLLGSSLAVKQISAGGSGFLLIGARQKTNRSLLQSQSTRGGYEPRFYDLQLFYHRNLNRKLSASYFGIYNFSRFLLTPTSNETEFGTSERQYRLTVHFEGEELSRNQSMLHGVGFTYKASDAFQLKWLSSSFNNLEREAFDLVGHYIFEDVDRARTGIPDSLKNRGSGVSHRRGQNSLNSTVYSSEVKGFLQKGRGFFEGGIKYQQERLRGSINEYSLVDSGRFNSPTGRDTIIKTVDGGHFLSRSRLSGYLQSSIESNGLTITGGLRSNFNWSGAEVLVSPRVSLSYEPESQETIRYRFSAGLYFQPTFYREMQDRNGTLYLRERAQRSVHYLAGVDKQISKLVRPLKFTSEIYYKSLSQLVPYKVENLQVQYFPEQKARGYAAGADFSLSGEFVEGLESSFRLSLLSSKEDIEGDFYWKQDQTGASYRFEPGYLRRPTDQRVNFSVFFQDKLFKSAEYKVHLTLLYGSRLPVGPPGSERYADKFSIPAYKRADIGFSRDFLTRHEKDHSRRKLRSFVFYAEIFNFFGNRNTVSYLWISDINSNQFAVPNHLTGRIFNFKVIGKFQ